MALDLPLRIMNGDQALDRQNEEFQRLFASIVPLIQATVFPIGSILAADITAINITIYFDSTGRGKSGLRWAGWAICNGNNGTKNLTGKVLRWQNTATAGSGATGGSDTQTAGVGTLVNSSESAHTHGAGSYVTTAAGTNSNESSHTHGAGSYVTTAVGSVGGHTHGLSTATCNLIAIIGTGFESNQISSTNSWNSTHKETNVTVTTSVNTNSSGTSLNGLTDSTTPTFTGNTSAVTGTSGAGSAHTHTFTGSSTAVTGTSAAGSAHTHTISGSTASFDNRPAYEELVPVMRIS